ncbi:hypothetical protein [Zymobacter sp. IVIA_12111.31 C1]|uniref:hypothetical protein n=1 Tax=Zymobacter sp. IVIA_12111.31 C1 TaxID=3394854 RepID=UPI0039C4A8B9
MDPLSRFAFLSLRVLQCFVTHPMIACRPADLPTCRPADLPTCRPADLPTCRPADLPTCRPADLPTCRPADLPTCRPADLPTCRPADLTYRMMCFCYSLQSENSNLLFYRASLFYREGIPQ